MTVEDFCKWIESSGFKDGDFEVFHRLYDICLIRVVSPRTMVGFFDMYTRIKYSEGEKE